LILLICIVAYVVTLRAERKKEALRKKKKLDKKRADRKMLQSQVRFNLLVFFLPRQQKNTNINHLQTYNPSMARFQGEMRERMGSNDSHRSMKSTHSAKSLSKRASRKSMTRKGSKRTMKTGGGSYRADLSSADNEWTQAFDYQFVFAHLLFHGNDVHTNGAFETRTSDRAPHTMSTTALVHFRGLHPRALGHPQRRSAEVACVLRRLLCRRTR